MALRAGTRVKKNKTHISCQHDYRFIWSPGKWYWRSSILFCWCWGHSSNMNGRLTGWLKSTKIRQVYYWHTTNYDQHRSLMSVRWLSGIPPKSRDCIIRVVRVLVSVRLIAFSGQYQTERNDVLLFLNLPNSGYLNNITLKVRHTLAYSDIICIHHCYLKIHCIVIIHFTAPNLTQVTKYFSINNLSFQVFWWINPMRTSK